MGFEELKTLPPEEIAKTQKNEQTNNIKNESEDTKKEDSVDEQFQKEMQVRRERIQEIENNKELRDKLIEKGDLREVDEVLEVHVDGGQYSHEVERRFPDYELLNEEKHYVVDGAKRNSENIAYGLPNYSYGMVKKATLTSLEKISSRQDRMGEIFEKCGNDEYKVKVVQEIIEEFGFIGYKKHFKELEIDEIMTIYKENNKDVIKMCEMYN